jgi:cyclic beta-1,2-glucan synthetase
MNMPPNEQHIPVLEACSTNPAKPPLEIARHGNTRRKVFSSIYSFLRRFPRSQTQVGFAPIREELFGIERLEQHAACLAGTQRIALSPVIDRRLEARLRDNDKALRLAYLTAIKASRDTRSTTPAAEWLIDNFHVLAEQVIAIRTDFPPGFYRQIPKLVDGTFEGYPRVFGLAWALVAHTDSRLESKSLIRFLRAYQHVQPLTIGELWAISITLRVVLVENLRRLADDIVNCQIARKEANSCADRLLGVECVAEPTGRVFSDRTGALSAAFAAQLVRRLREQDPLVVPALDWLNKRLAAQGSAADDAVHAEQQREGAANVTIRNVITSMRMLSSLDWRELFESVSLVDRILSADSDFAALDFPTRESYRRSIEILARGSKHTEIDVAHLAIEAAREAEKRAGDEDSVSSAQEREPGYYLIAKGRPAFEQAIGFRLTFKERIVRANTNIGIAGYIAVVIGVTFLLAAAMLHSSIEAAAGWEGWLVTVLAFFLASDVAIALVNFVATYRFDSKILPCLELAEGITPALRTMIVIPTLLTSRHAIIEQVERLQVHYLANSDAEFFFAMLTDWTDSNCENMPDDVGLLKVAEENIAALNLEYGSGPAGDRFLLLHRRRCWNEAGNCWTGWERKRGKLHEFDRLLRGAMDTNFVSVGGRAPATPSGVRYVIVLDCDTRLPRGAARRLVGKMAHPLNRPTLDPVSRRVVDGYAVLQPRVTPALPTGLDGSIFQRVFSNTSGIDPYACAVSDVYQDLFGEGSYCGKGIYDVDIFETALAGRIPDNTLLSHDLLEGIYARAGLVSDIEVVDEFPARYDVAVARQYRWVRGDWQLLPWIFGQGWSSDAVRRRQAIPLVGRWKMIDNLRRSISTPFSFLALVTGWIFPFVSADRWTAFIVVTIATPSLIPFFSALLPRRLGLSKRMHLWGIYTDLKLAVSQTILQVAFLAHQARVMSGAILLTLFRLTVSRRNLLEWVTAAQAKTSPPLDLPGFYKQMAGGVALAIVAAGLVVWVAPASWPIAAPFLLLWLLSPAIARWVSLPSSGSGRLAVLPADRRALRMIARRTWRFFETFVTAKDHMLPPDNFQEDPAPVIAHRTSPTNFGLYLLSVIAAGDFGWIGVIQATDRLEATLGSMKRLERFRGHFYNWYDTLDLRPLTPKYISSVDSGNLAGHLIALWNACKEIRFRPVVGRQWVDGIRDPTELLRESLREDGDMAGSTRQGPLKEAVDSLLLALLEVPSSPFASAVRANELALRSASITRLARVYVEGRCERDSGALLWAEAISACIADNRRCIDSLLPWAALLDPDNADPALFGANTQAGAGVELAALLRVMPTLSALPETCATAIHLLEPLKGKLEADGAGGENSYRNLTSLIAAFEASALAADALSARLVNAGQIARSLFDGMEFGFLFNAERELLSIGYRVEDGSLDTDCYDLLASEARLASFVAIAKGDLPTRHWFRLGRAMASVGYGAALISWSGSMFEYLMPSLVMRAPAGSLLDETCRQMVFQQIKYGASRHVPWGASESAYNARDLEFTYQYSSFGIPSLGLKRGLGENTVIAPYATALAAMTASRAAIVNFERLTKAGGRGSYGWYEALDYTDSRLPKGVIVVAIRAYMAHHQGMSVIAIANALDAGLMHRRFHAEPMIQATELLLQERMPHEVAIFEPINGSLPAIPDIEHTASSPQRCFNSPHTPSPCTHLLSNGAYTVMITAAGSGYSRWRDLSVTRWREDATCDCWGAYVFLRDLDNGEMWSAAYQPSTVEPDRYEATFSEGRAEIVRRDNTITTTLEIAVSSEDDGEVRRVSVTNNGGRVRNISLTSYAEIILAPHADADAHPAFSNLFVETEFVAEVGAILATRRGQSENDTKAWAAQIAFVEGETIGDLQFETDRSRFLGRGGSLGKPLAMIANRPLSNSAGAILDPIFSLRRHVRLQPGTTARIAFWTLIAPSRKELMDLVDKHHDAAAFDRATTLAWTQAQVQLRHLGIDADQAHLFQSIADCIIYSSAALRPHSEILKLGGGAASLLWPSGISGDLPIVLIRVDHNSDLDIVRQLLLAHEYWRMKQLFVDLVILNEHPASYLQGFQTALETLVRGNCAAPKRHGKSATGAIFALRADLISTAARNLLQTAARAVFVGHRGSLSQQMAKAPRAAVGTRPPRGAVALPGAQSAPAPLDLEFFNGVGGFARGGAEYVATLEHGLWTPAPWINVISNESFGFQVSVEGGGCTWALNSQQNLISPWSNDPVLDSPGEVIYVRDEDSGELWGPTALPIREPGTAYRARHGQGYSRFEHASNGVELELTQYVPVKDSIKISRLKITNRSGRRRRLSVTAYVEWTLGASRLSSAPFIVTDMDERTGAMFARNPWNLEFGSQITFADLAGRQSSWTGDRKEFLGRHGVLALPAALAGNAPLSKRVGAGLDPCGALQTRLELEPDGVWEIVFFLGQAATEADAQSLLMKYRAANLDAELAEVTALWDETVGVVQVATPDRSMDIFLNRWLLYQTLSSRVWARSAFYQNSGAYGFRDQLQDVMALCVSKPEVTRAHLLRAAARQFVEGDVQHWWLPGSGKGVRTHISDDLIWLPYVVAHYIEVTGDLGVLDETIPFLEGPLLREGEHEAFFAPVVSDERGSLFEHCARALDRSLATGRHGLPFIGTGDWNDGMNRIGVQGKGESIWLGWFLHAALADFAPLADTRKAPARAAEWRKHMAALGAALEKDGWDGEWYRRAFFDDYTALGSAANSECRIDSIAQSWSVISRAGEPGHARRAMAAVDKFLVRREEDLVLLFDPPFDKTLLDPGYIKAYPPGVRENGGQYTHGALWCVIAFAMLGDGDKAAELFSMLNPINHTRTPESAGRYKVEPYVACADVYSQPPHVGRGGWTWYTGSAGWMYRAGLEWILGFRLQGETLMLNPCIPKTWPGYSLEFRYKSSRYNIRVENPNGVCRGVVVAELDGVALRENKALVPLADDGATHRLRVVLGHNSP